MKLYVDFVSPDESIAITTSDESIRYNMHQLGNISERYTHICGIGRYICLFVAKDEDIIQMLFLDLRKNGETAKELMRLLSVQKAFKRKFISLIELWNAEYDNNFYMLELVKGEPSLR